MIINIKGKVNGETLLQIVTTHVMGEADKCDFLAMVREGRILTKGTPKELKDAYKVTSLEDVFLKAVGDYVMRIMALVKRKCNG